MLQTFYLQSQLEEERVTPIEARSPVKIIEQIQNTWHMFGNMTTHSYTYVLLFLVRFNNYDRFGILRSYMLFPQAAHAFLQYM